MAVTDLYNAEFMDHVSHPDYKYQMDCPDCTHEGVNPSCGDELTFSVRFADDGTIDEAAFTGHGCAISQASADIMAELITDKTVEEARDLSANFLAMIRGEKLTDEQMEALGDATELESISRMPARVKCAQLAWRTLDEILSEGEQPAE